ncbi:Alpha-aminoadipic semialdehyde synthase, mitochondrial [Termitomyces sp. J132]|nr:Alpha-aminoadipic semialdehyde synthase, mitochondrial [Termitomyces sp. J132]
MDSSQSFLHCRREDPKRIWERRAPLTPKGVKELVEGGVNVEIEHCDRRVFKDEEYIAAGASIAHTLSNSHIILGIKEPPLAEILTSGITAPLNSAWANRGYVKIPRTHLMFSHTVKGQAYNMPLLAKFVVQKGRRTPNAGLIPRIVDYEMLTDESGKRTVGFGWFAGVAGVLESLSSMAQSHLENGIATPFLSTPRPHTHPTLQSIRQALRTIGDRIAQGGIPPALGPFVVGLTGNGNVAHGCLDILQELPIEKVEIKDLHTLVKNPDTPLNKIYLAHAKPQDYFIRRDGQPYDRAHYYAYPQSYRSTFHEKVCCLIFPFLLFPFPLFYTFHSAAHPLSLALDRARAFKGFRFRNIGDISCDIEGGLQFLTKSTTLTAPSYKITPPPLPGVSLPEVQMMAVDILPATLPLDASVSFERAVLPFVWRIVAGYMRAEGVGGFLDEALEHATIARRGELMEGYRSLEYGLANFWKREERSFRENGRGKPVPENRTQDSRGERREKKKKVLMLGSGMVARPAVEVIARRGDVQLVVVSNSLVELEKLSKEFLNIQYRVVDVDDWEPMEALIGESDVVVSLLPVPFHARVARKCLQDRKHLVTASYVTPEMFALHDKAVAANVLFLNEIGLDPGIDHLTALDLISRLQSDGQIIQSFTSFCGGLPAPDVEHTPLRYKFSWNPRGVLQAALASAKFWLKGENHTIPDGDVLKNVFPDVPVTDEIKLEGLANRSSIAYREAYRLFSTQNRTFVRGTLRYPGFSSLMDSFRSLGFLNAQDQIYLPNWHSFVRLCIAQQLGIKGEATATLPPDAITRLVPSENIQDLHSALEWLGLVPTLHAAYTYTKPLPPLPSGAMAPINIFAYLLAHQLAYKPHERDMVVLSHEIITRDPHTAQERVYTSSLIEYGTDRSSAMARTVGIPVGIAALLVLDGKIELRGVARPLHESVYMPVLSGLEEFGLNMKETVRSLGKVKRTVESALKESWKREVKDVLEESVSGSEKWIKQDVQKDVQIL